MQPRRRNAVGDREIEFGHQAVEHLAGGARVHAPAPVEAEQRRVVVRARRLLATLELLGDQLADARPVRDEAALAELAAHHDEQLRSRVDVAEAQPAGLTGPQPEPVAEGEDRPVGRAPLGCAGLSGKAAAASSSRRAWAVSNRNGTRAEVARRRRVRSGEACSSS